MIYMALLSLRYSCLSRQVDQPPPSFLEIELYTNARTWVMLLLLNLAKR